MGDWKSNVIEDTKSIQDVIRGLGFANGSVRLPAATAGCVESSARASASVIGLWNLKDRITTEP